MLFSLVSVMLLSRYRTLEEYGTYSQILTVINLAVTIFMLGLPSCINYFLPRARNASEKDSFLSTYFLFTLALSVVAGIVLFIALPLIEGFYSNAELENFAYAFVILPWGSVAFGSMSNLLVASNKAKRVIAINFAYSVLTVLIVVISPFAEDSFSFYMMLYVGLQCAFGLLTYYEASKLMSRHKIVFEKDLVRQFLSFSVPIGLASAMSTISLELGKLIVGNLFDASTLAVYTNASKELPFAFVGSSFTAALLPVMSRLFAENKKTEALRLWGRSVEFSYIVICFIVAALIAFAPQVVGFLCSEKYLAGVNVFRICCVVLLCRITYFGMILNVTGNTRMVFWSSILSLIANALLCIVFVPSFGLIGPALSMLVSTILVALVQLAYSAHVISVPLKEVFPWRSLGLITLVNIGISIAMTVASVLLSLGSSAIDIAISLVIILAIMIIYLLCFRRKLVSIWKELR